MAATIELGREVPARSGEILTTLPGLVVRSGRSKTTLRVNGRSWPLALVSGGIRPYARATATLLVALAGPDKLSFVVAARLPEHVRRELESAGCAYADGTGAAHIDVPGLYVHIEGHSNRRRTTGHAPAGIGVVGVRPIQSLLAEPGREWSVPELARAAASSTGEAHRVLARLQDEGLGAATGRARSLRRTVANPGDLL